MRTSRLATVVLSLVVFPWVAHAEIGVRATYLRQEVPLPPVLSSLDEIPEDQGIAGAELGLADNMTTGKFMGHDYSLKVVSVPEGGDWEGAAREALSDSPLVIVDAPAEAQQSLADLPEAEGALLFNASASDVSLRMAGCRRNLFHTIPSDAMRADALAQFLLKRQYGSLAMVTGGHPQDLAFAEALRVSIQKFGLKLKAEKPWDFDADMRRNASQEVPLFTQEFGEYDMLLVADELGDFGRYIAYNTWRPRPVTGSEGLRPVAWAPVVEQWGAAQLQSRFVEQSGREMRPEDYAAWAAMRTIGEAVTRTGTADPATLRAYILSDAFELAGFKGRSMSYRRWNGQLRQPVPLVTERAVVEMAPLEGFLHHRSELDTLGIDDPGSQCTAFSE